MSKFKVGDRISWKNAPDRVYEITVVHGNECYNFFEVNNIGNCYYSYLITGDVIKINYSKNMSNLIEKAKLAFKKEPEKSFIKAGILNVDETFTDEGRNVFLEYLLKKHGGEFKTEVVDPILAEEKDE